MTIPVLIVSAMCYYGSTIMSGRADDWSPLVDVKAIVWTPTIELNQSPAGPRHLLRVWRWEEEGRWLAEVAPPMPPNLYEICAYKGTIEAALFVDGFESGDLSYWEVGP